MIHPTFLLHLHIFLGTIPNLQLRRGGSGDSGHPPPLPLHPDRRVLREPEQLPLHQGQLTLRLLQPLLQPCNENVYWVCLTCHCNEVHVLIKQSQTSCLFTCCFGFYISGIILNINAELSTLWCPSVQQEKNSSTIKLLCWHRMLMYCNTLPCRPISDPDEFNHKFMK